MGARKENQRKSSSQRIEDFPQLIWMCEWQDVWVVSVGVGVCAYVFVCSCSANPGLLVSLHLLRVNKSQDHCFCPRSVQKYQDTTAENTNIFLLYAHKYMYIPLCQMTKSDLKIIILFQKCEDKCRDIHTHTYSYF